MTGHITDGVGFILNLKEHGVEVKGQEMVIIGTVFIEDLDNKEKLAEVVSESNILVNATRAGMAPLENVIPVPEERLRPELAVADVVYNLLETLLVKKVKEAGCRAAIGGIGMLLWQGAAVFELFTGKEMPVDEVKEKFFSEA